MSKTIMLALHVDDAEPILRQAAREAAKYSAWCDYITSRVANAPATPTVETKKQWMEWFLSAKRKVEAFGVEYEPTSEEETMTVHWPYVGGKRVPFGKTGFMQIIGSKPDYAHPQPFYRGETHSQACTYAADRVVRRWRETLKQSKAA